MWVMRQQRWRLPEQSNHCKEFEECYRNEQLHGKPHVMIRNRHGIRLTVHEDFQWIRTVELLPSPI